MPCAQACRIFRAGEPPGCVACRDSASTDRGCPSRACGRSATAPWLAAAGAPPAGVPGSRCFAASRWRGPADEELGRGSGAAAQVRTDNEVWRPGCARQLGLAAGARCLFCDNGWTLPQSLCPCRSNPSSLPLHGLHLHLRQKPGQLFSEGLATDTGPSVPPVRSRGGTPPRLLCKSIKPCSAASY